MKLQDLTITTKILVSLAVMAALAVGTNLYALSSLTAIDTAYSELLEHEAAASLAMARTDRAAADVGRIAYKMLAETRDEERRRLAGRLDEEAATFRKLVGEGRRLPETRDEVDRLSAEFEAIAAAVPALTGAILARRDEEARVMMNERLDAPLLTLRARIRAFNAGLARRLEEASADATATTVRVHRLTLAVVAAGILLCLGVAAALSRAGIVLPIRRTVATMEALAAGDLSARIAGGDRRDEVGAIARTLEVFKEGLLRNRRMEEEAKQAEAAARAEKRAAMMELAGRFEERVGGIVGAVGGAATELQATASQLAAAVEQVGAQCNVVTAASEEASANVQTVAAASEEMSAAIDELSTRVGRAAGRSKAAAEGADLAQKQLDALCAAIEQVDQIVAAISSVASQTNLLALNATIEAARAGEMGKGFAVVASEVKGLANQTHSMTEQIGNQIAAVKGASARTVEAMRAIIGQVEDIDRSAAEMAVSVQQQSAATGEISRNAQQAATGTAEVSRNIAGVQQAETETSAATGNVKSAADRLAGQAAMLKREVDGFLAEVRAA